MKQPAFVLDAERGIVTQTGARVAPAHPHNHYLLDILNKRHNGGEWRAVRRIITLLKRRGWVLSSIWDGETLERPATTLEALAIIFNLDESSVRFRRPESKTEHGIWFVLGNASDGSEVAADWNYSEGDADGFNKDMDAVTGY